LGSRTSRRGRPVKAAIHKQAADPSLDLRGLEFVQSFEDLPGVTHNIAWSTDGALIAAVGDGPVTVWRESARKPESLPGYQPDLTDLGLSWHPDRATLATASVDGRVMLWEIDSQKSSIFCRLDMEARAVEWSPDGFRLAVTDVAGGVGIWDSQTGDLITRARRHEAPANRPCWSSDGTVLATCGLDGVISVQTSNDLRLLHRFNVQNVADDRRVWDIDLSPEGRTIASAHEDGTVRLWDLTTGKETAALEGHRRSVEAVRFSRDGEFLASLASDQIRLWRCRDWECVATSELDHAFGIGGLAFHPRRPLLAAKNWNRNQIDCFKIDYTRLLAVGIRPSSRRYVNAKVVLLGDTGVGKSGLALVLSGQSYQPTDSTHGRNVWTFDAQEIEVTGVDAQTREVLLWDLAGQPGYRLIHQLHPNEVAVALVVFDSRSETDPFSGVKHWVRALAQARRLEGAAAVPLHTYLVAARADRGGVSVTRDRIEAMIDDLGLDGFFETSAKEGWQITELGHAILDNIPWDALPMVSSSALFDLIKQFLLEEKQQGRLLSTVDDLFRSFQRAHRDITNADDLRTSFEVCIGRVESRGLIRLLHFGDLVLLQPELLDAYASALVQAAKEEPEGLGFIAEEDALEGRFRMPGSERVRDRAQEKLLLIATVEELLRHEIALKEMTDRGADLVFPSQFTRERPGAPDIPGKQVTFSFEGPLHSVYATLAVRLSHSSFFNRQAMWQNAAFYTSAAGGTCGIHLRELEDGRGELALSYDEQASAAVRVQFETYVSEHLQLRALKGTVRRRRVRACTACEFVLPDELIRRRLELGNSDIRCPVCEASVISLVSEEPLPSEAVVSAMNRSADQRRDQNIAATRLKGKIETGDYDVFLCYNSKDRENVMKIGERLRERGLLPWLDIWEIPPGVRWQKELQRRLKSIKSAAVFIGPKGPGPWQELEVESMLQQLAKRDRPIIPVILQGRAGHPRLPPFLGLWHAVDMRRPEPDPFEQLVWGITGERVPILAGDTMHD